jgi:acetoin utilization protein AcuB
MTSPAITMTTTTETPRSAADDVRHKIRRLPVVDDRGALVGIVTQRDLYEKGKAATRVGDIMTVSPYTTSPDAPLVQAALFMRHLGIGALPVVERGRVVGIITESDIFGGFLELLGARRAGTRLIVPVPDIAGDIARLLKALEPAGAQLTRLTTNTVDGQSWVIMTFDERDPRDLVRAIKTAGFGLTLVSVQDTA